jgi:bifunctional oligoribonuclease and PAP phosphatase NrnA
LNDTVVSKPSPNAQLLSVHGDKSDARIAAEIKALVEKSPRILISGHERPDGDCIGSEVALCATLRANGFNASIINSDPTPDRYRYLDPDQLIRQAKPEETYSADLVIVVDATDLKRLGKLKPEQFGNATLIDIDHHLNNPAFGVVNFIDTKASSSGELVWRLVSHCAWKVPHIALQALYTAIVTDTGQFSYSNTTPRVLHMAAELVEKGVDPEVIWNRVYLNRALNELELESRARASLVCAAGGKICRVSLTHKDFVETKTGSQHTEELASIPRSLSGVELALFLYEVNEGKDTKVSIRTMRGLDACALAQKFGGGGHRQAAGCIIQAPLPEATKRLMTEAEKLIS